MSFIISITGPTSAGKTTVSQALAEKTERCVNIDVDHFKHLIVTGFIYDKTDDGLRQWRLLGENVGQTAKNFAEQDYNIIINGYLDPLAWDGIEGYVLVDKNIVLLPELEANKTRNDGRSSDVKMEHADVERHQQDFRNNPFYSDFYILDTTDHSLVQTVHEIQNLIEEVR